MLLFYIISYLKKIKPNTMQSHVYLNCQTIKIHGSSSMSEKEITKHNKSKCDIDTKKITNKPKPIETYTKEKQTVTTIQSTICFLN